MQIELSVEVLKIHKGDASYDSKPNGLQFLSGPRGGVLDEGGAVLSTLSRIDRFFAIWCADRRGPVGEAALAAGWTKGAALHRAPNGPLKKLFEQIASGAATRLGF